MRTLTKALTEEWLSAAGLLDHRRRADFKKFASSIRIDIPGDAGRKTNLARLLAHLAVSQREGLLWIDEFGIWPSSENWVLFNALRSVIPEHRTIQDVPGHLFDAQDEELLSGLLALALYFCWGAVLVSGSENIVVRINHDEYAEFYGTEADLVCARQVLTVQGYLS